MLTPMVASKALTVVELPAVPMSAYGYKQTSSGQLANVRFAPESGHSDAQERLGLKKRLQVVADDLRSLAKEGLSLLEIARGIQTARGRQWGAEGVSRALAQAVPWDGRSDVAGHVRGDVVPRRSPRMMLMTVSALQSTNNN